ncbi:serine-rich adhesin for platelets-like [Bolinopsis microptera]|uniref:serine-rich adhesin for platelets-like n=1 Tax=Bolinopsis microptera TaxID=2820187 RepID=UPI003079B136
MFRHPLPILLFGFLQMVQPTVAAQSLQFGITFGDYVRFYPDVSNVKYALTVCSWVKKQQTGTARSWITYTTSTHGYEILISDAGSYNYIHGNCHGVSVSVPLNTWTHQCQSWSTSSALLKVYYNGTMVGSMRVGNTPLEEGGYILLGHDSGDSGPSESEIFGGQLMKLNIFGKELSRTEVAELYQGGRCSEVEKKFDNVRFITWESILSQPRTGNVRKVNSGCPPVTKVESVNIEVKKGSYATISCIITGITDTATVTWRTSTEPVSGDKQIPTQGSNSDGTQTSTLAVDGTLVNEDTAYTCRVTSGSLPDSNFSDTTVNLNVYDVESVNTEVKIGSYATISCIITGITETAAVTWRTSTGPVSGDKLVPTQGSHSDGTQTSTLAVDGTLVNEDTAYTCRVTSGSLPDSNFSDTTVNLNVYDVESVNTEVKKGSYATISCIITGITETVAVTWRTSTGPVSGGKLVPTQGSHSDGTQTSTLAVDGTLVNEDTAYTCRVTSGSLPDSNFSDTNVNLNVYDVESVNTEVKKGSYATISCIITGITETAAVTWRTSIGPVSDDKLVPTQGSHFDGTQISTLAVDGTLVNEDTAYTCKVTSGSLPDSNFSDTNVNLNVYDVESVNTEVKKGSYATISCIITGITETAAVTWRTSIGPVSDDKLVPTQGSHFDGTQISTLAVDGTLVNEDTAYTCRVTSGSLPDSNFFDTTVNLNFYDVESVNTEVKKGSYATISCIITGITETAALTWQTSTRPVLGDKLVPTQGRHSDGTQTSTLAVDGTLVNEHTAYTCRVTSGSLPDSNFSDTTVNLNVYDVESVNTEVKKGSYATISCIITGITETAAVTWRTSTGPVLGDKLVPTQGRHSDGTQTSTLAVDGTLVNEDTAYTCRVTSGSLPDSNFSDTTVNLNVYDVESVNTEVKKGSYATISCIITGITETAALTWQTSTRPVLGDKLVPTQGRHSDGTQTSTLAVDGTLVKEHTAYTCRVTSGSLPDSNFSDTTVNLNVYDVESVNTEVKIGSYATISCIITGITDPAAVTWRTSTGPVSGDKLVPTQGSHSDGTQTSTLAVDGTLVNEDTAYTCRVTSGSLPDSNFSDTTVNLNVYDVESVNTEVKTGSYATISCIITGITETVAVTWRTSTGPVSGDKLVPTQGSHSDGTQTSTLAVDGTLVNEDTAYTCRVTSGSLPDSNFFDTTVNLNFYDVESVNTEVKKGSYATISCIITGITETAAVTWRTSTGPVSGDKLVSTQGSNSDGTQTSTLAVYGTLVNEDTAYTCRVTSGFLPDSNFSDTTVNLNIYDVESVNTEVKKGSYATISCIITGITETAAVTWRTSTGPVSGDKLVPTQGSHSDGTQTSTLAVDGTLVNDDTAYTCRVTSGSLSDSNFSDTTVNLNVNDLSLTPMNVIRAFKGATIELKSSHFFSSIAEGHFWWKHNDSLCLTKLAGEAVAMTPVLTTEGRRAILTTYFTAIDVSDVRITWQKRKIGE